MYSLLFALNYILYYCKHSNAIVMGQQGCGNGGLARLYYALLRSKYHQDHDDAKGAGIPSN